MATRTTNLIEGCKLLTVEDFSQPATACMFTEMMSMFNDGQPVDETTLAARIPEHVRPALRDAIEGLTAGSDKMFAEYAGILSDRRLRRSIRFAAEDAVRAASEEGDVTNALGVLENHAFNIREMHAGKKRKKRFTMPELGQWFGDYLSDDWKDDGEYCFHHGMPGLRSRLGPFARGEFGIIAGYSGDGKSVYGLQMAEYACQQGHSVGYYSLEMPERQILRRLASMVGVPLGAIKHRTWTEEQLALLQARREEMNAWNLDVWSTSVLPDQIRADQMKYKYDMIIIDHLHRMPDCGERTTLERYVRSCKSLALDSNCAVIALAQLSRRDGFPPPTTNQLRGTDVLTQEPDWCVFVYRERDEQQKRLNSSRMIVGKMRDGESDVEVECRLNPDRMRFEEPPVGISVLDRRTLADAGDREVAHARFF